MKRRVAIWGCVGFLVACFWTLYAFETAPDYEIPMSSIENLVWDLARVTCPIIVAGVRFWWVLPINAITYALIGLIVEALRRSNPRIQE